MRSSLHIAPLLVLVLCTALTLQYVPPPPLDRAAYDILHGMSDNKDPFDSLRQHDKESYLSDIESSRDLSEMVNSLLNFEDKTLVQIKLVGLEDIKPSDLTPYLDALDTFDPLYSLEGRTEEDKLTFGRKILFEVKHAPASLFLSISSEIEKNLKAGITRIPYKSVDEIVRADYNSTATLSHVIYVINPGAQEKDYLYTQYERTEDDQPRSCGTPMWSGKDRYMWIDLRAGPVNYGPQLVGEGFVDAETLPYMKRYSSSKSGQLKVDLASFVHHTTTYLLAPSMTRFPTTWTTLNIHLVMIHDHAIGGHEESDLFNWDAIKEQIHGIPNLNGLAINFVKSEKSLLSDYTCAQIKSGALRSYAKRSKSSQITTSYYLDSKELHHWLNIYKSGLIGKTLEGEITIPVFLFDISYQNDILLLDRVHQAVSFPDMVVAIQTQHPQIGSDFSCNGNTVYIDPRDATRPVLAAILQSVWGIAPTHQTWNEVQKRIESDYIWSLSLTPFAPFSIHSQLSFAHGDAAARHLLYANLQSTLSPLAEKLYHFLDYSWEMGDILDEEEYLDFTHRWNFLHFKLSQTKKYLALNLFNASFAFVRSTQYDVDALSEKLEDVHERIHSYLKCGETTVDYASIGSVSLTCILIFVTVIVFLRRLAKWRQRSAKVKRS